MKKYYGTRFNSQWDASTWTIIAMVAACCIVNCLFEEWMGPLIICVIMLCFVITCFIGVFYRIDGNNLVVYLLFIPRAYPIDKMKEVKPTKLWTSAPATSVTHRIAIVFSDRNILKSTTPLIISPVRQQEFINALLSVNPDIMVEGFEQ